MKQQQKRFRRKPRKPQQELPKPQDESPLWEPGQTARKARKTALLRQDAQAEKPRKRHLNKKLRKAMLASMPGWVFDNKLQAFVPLSYTVDSDGRPLAGAVDVESLLDALARLRPGQTPAIRVRGLDSGTYSRARGYLERSTLLIRVP